MPELTMGSLFDGIGVFPLAASRHGIMPVWASEIVPDAISITKRHFPEMVHLGDITALSGSKIPAVDVITFGSPCQNFSQIGDKSGIQGVKSSLFYQAIRIIDEMRNASGNRFPAIAVWENVIGAQLSGNRLDYLAVLRAFAGTEIPMPASGQWADAGMVRGRQCDLAWRILDAQYWANPRIARRQRIFLVADFTGQRAGEVLFKSRPLFQNFNLCSAGGVSAAETNRGDFIEAGRRIPIVQPFSGLRMRGGAKHHDQRMFLRSFGKRTDPFPTLLASELYPFAFWYEDDPSGGCIRFSNRNGMRATYGAARKVDKIWSRWQRNLQHQPLYCARKCYRAALCRVYHGWYRRSFRKMSADFWLVICFILHTFLVAYCE